jgi:hypothetical protein
LKGFYTGIDGPERPGLFFRLSRPSLASPEGLTILVVDGRREFRAYSGVLAWPQSPGGSYEESIFDIIKSGHPRGHKGIAGSGNARHEADRFPAEVLGFPMISSTDEPRNPLIESA